MHSKINNVQMLDPAGIYLLKVNSRNIGTRCETCSKVTIKTLEWGQWRCSGVRIVKFEHISQRISHLVLVFLLLTLTCDFRLENDFN